MRCAAVFEKENALPGAELHFSVSDRYGFAAARQDHPDVRWHVVAAFRGVREIIGIFRHEALEKFLQVATRARVGIFHDHNAAAGVLNEKRDGSILDGAFVYRRLNSIGDFVEALAIGAHFQLVMADMHAIHVIRR